jgi:hypothetical protein
MTKPITQSSDLSNALTEVRKETELFSGELTDELESFARLNADPRVREYFPGLLSPQESNTSIKIRREQSERNKSSFNCKMR